MLGFLCVCCVVYRNLLQIDQTFLVINMLFIKKIIDVTYLVKMVHFCLMGNHTGISKSLVLLVCALVAYSVTCMASWTSYV